jgi:hypothetical protein
VRLTSEQSTPPPDINTSPNELVFQIANAQAANAHFLNQLTALKSALEEALTSQAELNRYELWKAPSGTLLYRLKESRAAGEPEHFLCPHCIQNKRKSILQGKDRLYCIPCKVSFVVEPRARHTPPKKVWKH